MILDVNLSGMSGLELQQRLNASKLEVPIIFMSTHADEATQLGAINAGAAVFAQAIQYRITARHPRFEISL
ncbi:MAG TPA: response regulator [Pyrinomonadaceae bacterium]